MIIIIIIIIIISILDTLFVPSSTNSIEKKYFGKSIITEQPKKFLAAYGVEKFIIVLTAASHWTLY
jgi:Tfp pilus assembly protein PilE